MTACIISGDRTLSHADLQARAERAAAGFAALGIGRGDAVAIMLRNNFAFFEASAAIGQLGGYPVPVNWHYTIDEAGLPVPQLRRRGDRRPCRSAARHRAGPAGGRARAGRADAAEESPPPSACRPRRRRFPPDAPTGTPG